MANSDSDVAAVRSPIDALRSRLMGNDKLIAIDGALGNEFGCAFIRPTTARDVRASRIQLSEPIEDDAKLRLLAVVIPSRDADGQTVKIGFAVERRRADDGQWESIMADLDDEADADNCDRAEKLFGLTQDEAREMVRRALASRNAVN